MKKKKRDENKNKFSTVYDKASARICYMQKKVPRCLIQMSKREKKEEKKIMDNDAFIRLILWQLPSSIHDKFSSFHSLFISSLFYS